MLGNLRAENEFGRPDPAGSGRAAVVPSVPIHADTAAVLFNFARF